MIIFLMRALMALIGVSIAAIAAPLMMVGIGIPLFMLGMSMLLVAIDGDWSLS